MFTLPAERGSIDEEMRSLIIDDDVAGVPQRYARELSTVVSTAGAWNAVL